MRIVANERTLPKLHLVGSILIVLALTASLGIFFVWRSLADQQISLDRLTQSVDEQHQARLQSEMGFALEQIEFTRTRTEEVLRKSIREQVDTAMQIVQAIYDRESPHNEPDVVKRKIVEALRPVRFYDGRGYFFIDDFDGKFILLPTAPKFEGTTNLENRDDTGKYIMRGLIDAAHQPQGEGYFSYRWYAPGADKVMADKLAYVRSFAPYHWLIGTGDYFFKWEEQQQQEVIARLRNQQFGHTGHIVLADRQGRLLISPLNPSEEGKNFSERPPAMRAVFEKFFSQAKRGGGFVQYVLPNPQSGTTVAKTALVRQIDPWGWVVVVTAENSELFAALQQERTKLDVIATRRWSELALILALALGLGFSASYAFGRWSQALFKTYHDDIRAKNLIIQEREALVQAVLDNAAVGIAQITLDGRYSKVNQYYCDFVGYSREEMLENLFTFEKVSHPEDYLLDLENIGKMLDGKTIRYDVEKRYIRKDGRTVWGDLSVNLVRDAAGNACYWVSAVHDITERKHAEAKLRLAASVFSHAREGIMITEPDGTIIDVNETFTQITGFPSKDVIGKNPRILKSGRHSSEHYQSMWQTLITKGYWYGEVWNRRKDGKIFAEMQTISAVPDAKGKVQHYVSLFTDISPLKEHQAQLERIAHYDTLTNLPNRLLLADRLQQAILQVARRKVSLAVAYLDLDGFKEVNDRFGHAVGDELLCTLADRLRSCLRDGDTLARIGGDEFVAVLVDLRERQECDPVLQRMLDAASTPVIHDGNTLQVSLSIGVTHYPSDDSDADLLIRHADHAMYQAKQAGKNRSHWFDIAHDTELHAIHENQKRIQAALEQQEFVLYYQPKVNLQTNEVIGAEALIRWQHPQRGLLPPSEFLPMIENRPISIDVGEWVIHTALKQLENWRDAGLEIPVSVNVAAVQLQQDGFPKRLDQLLKDHPGMHARLLELEVLESAALQDLSKSGEAISICRSLGVGFALDDFGTGYSSLSYLRHLPVDTLKIDQSFVRGMLDNPNDLAIVNAVIGLGRAFSREVIAEGVETAAHARLLQSLGCVLAQGFGIAKPMPADELPAWAERWKSGAVWTT